MRKIYQFLPLLALPVIFILMASSSGSPGGKTGSPGDNGVSCTQCHTGTPQNASEWITTDIPVNGYIGGETYVITATGTHAGVGKFGFELTAEDESGNKVGSFTLLNTDETQYTNGNNAVTHTSQGNTPSGDSKTWEMEWTAPEEIPGDITFFAAFNAANGNGSTSGDVIYLTDLTVSADVTGIDELAGHSRVYPNPTNGIVNITNSEINQPVYVYNQSGQIVEKFVMHGNSGTFNLSHLSKGIYFVKTGNENEQMQKLIIR